MLAIAYKANRQVDEAMSLLKQVVKIEEQTLTEDGSVSGLVDSAFRGK